MTDALGGAFARALDQLAFAVLLIAADGRVVFANTTARTMLSSGSRKLPSGSDGRPVAPIEPWIDEHAPHAAVGLTVHGGRGTRPLLLFAVPLPPADDDTARSDDVAAMAVLVDTSPVLPVPARDGEPCFGMTPAECNIAWRLGNGSTLDEVARSAGVARNTVRSHLKRIFLKLGVNRQADLVRVITIASVLRGR